MTITDHKITITVELTDGTVVQKVQGFNGGNPLFHAKETAAAAAKAQAHVEAALAGIYGDIRGREL